MNSGAHHDCALDLSSCCNLPLTCSPTLRNCTQKNPIRPISMPPSHAMFFQWLHDRGSVHTKGNWFLLLLLSVGVASVPGVTWRTILHVLLIRGHQQKSIAKALSNCLIEGRA